MTNDPKQRDVKEYYVDEIFKLLFALKTEFEKEKRERQEHKPKIIKINCKKETTDNAKQN